MDRPRIIIVGAAWYGDWGKNFFNACLRLGLNAEMVYNNSAPAPLGGHTFKVTDVFERTKRTLRKYSPFLFRALKMVRTRLADLELLWRARSHGEKVIVIFVWTPGSPWVLGRLRARRDVVLVLWHGEPPIRDASWAQRFKFFHHLFIVDEGIWMEELPPGDRERAKLLPLSSDETTFFPMRQKEPARACEVVFVGQYVASRARTLGRIKDRDLVIHGYGWEKGFAEFPWLQEKYRGPVAGDELNLVYNNAEIVIGTLGAPNDPHTTATQRTFDIALSGAFQIAQDVALIRKIFGGSIETFRSDEEFERLVRSYLADPHKKEELKARSYRTALEQSYTARARQILSACGYSA
jgi:hypothetical protein